MPSKKIFHLYPEPVQIVLTPPPKILELFLCEFQIENFTGGGGGGPFWILDKYQLEMENQMLWRP